MGPSNIRLDYPSGNNGVVNSPFTVYGFTLPGGACIEGDSGGPVWMPPSPTASPNDVWGRPIGIITGTAGGRCYALALDDQLASMNAELL